MNDEELTDDELDAAADDDAAEATGYDIPAPPTPGDAPAQAQLRTIFAVVIDNEGIAQLVSTRKIEPLLAASTFDHEAQIHEIRSALSQVKQDLDEIAVAQRVVMNLNTMGQMMAQQAEADAIARATNGGVPAGAKLLRPQG